MPAENPIKVISLDQCFLSNLALNPSNGDRFHLLKESVLKAVGCGKLVCPAHVEETISESVLLPEVTREKVIALQNELSLGVAFRGFGELLELETLSLVRPTFQFEPFKVELISIPESVDVQKLAFANRAAKAEAVALAKQLPYPPKSYSPNDNLDDIANKVGTERAASMYRITRAILEKGDLNTGKPEWPYTQAVGEFLLQRDITELECHNLLSKILNHEWETIPILGLHTILWAKVEEDMIKAGRAFKANDHIDILKLAVGLGFADAIACDTPMKEVVKQTKLAQATKVFSIRELHELCNWIAV